MTDFLVGDELSKKIRTVTAGRDVRCAVAYWGIDCQQLVGDAVDRAKIICDAVSGGTAPKALNALGAPHNGNLRHSDKLHAKVYLSDAGAVVGSANASRNGIGFDGMQSGLIEAAVFCGADSEVWRAASLWFDELFASASVVDEEALRSAQEKWRPHFGKAPNGSVIELACAEPDLFDGIGFVFSGTNSEQKDVDDAKKKAAKDTGEKARFRNWPSTHMFTEWPAKQVDRWPSQFFSFHKPHRRLTVSAKRLDYRDAKQGAVFARQARLALGPNRKLPTMSAASTADADLVQSILDVKGESCIFETARSLASFIRENELR